MFFQLRVASLSPLGRGLAKDDEAQVMGAKWQPTNVFFFSCRFLYSRQNVRGGLRCLDVTGTHAELKDCATLLQRVCCIFI